VACQRAAALVLRVEQTVTPCNTPQHHKPQHTATHCNTLKHTAVFATYCNTLQDTARHCNTLQHTATHCNTLQHTATRNTLHLTATHGTHCNALQRTAGSLCGLSKSSSSGAARGTHCNTLQHTATLHTTTHCNTLQHTKAHCNTLQHTATHCNTRQAHSMARQRAMALVLRMERHRRRSRRGLRRHTHLLRRAEDSRVPQAPRR